MARQLRPTIALAAAIAFASSAIAIAAQPLKGRIYAGVTSHEKVSVQVKVSKNGRSVTVYVPNLPLYCQGGGGPVQQSTKPAKVSSSGSFSGSISYIFQGKVAYKGAFKGRFITRKVIKGTLRSEYKGGQCNGSTSFQAVPAGAL